MSEVFADPGVCLELNSAVSGMVVIFDNRLNPMAREPNGKLTGQFLRKRNMEQDGVDQGLRVPRKPVILELLAKEVLAAVDRLDLETFSVLDLRNLNVV